MADLVRVATLVRARFRRAKSAWVSGIEVLLVNLDDEIVALDEQCTHMERSLLDAPMLDNMLICPRHPAANKVRTGKVLRGPATVDLPTWTVKTEGDGILVQERPIEML